MKDAHETGAPVMRPLYYDFPKDPSAAQVEDSYMFGPDLLVSPVMEPGVTERPVYLPGGSVWKDAYTGKEYRGGQTVIVPAPIHIIPVMIRDGADLVIYQDS
jgi:alpha-D-xyloside xylohydrolase